MTPVTGLRRLTFSWELREGFRGGDIHTRLKRGTRHVVVAETSRFQVARMRGVFVVGNFAQEMNPVL